MALGHGDLLGELASKHETTSSSKLEVKSVAELLTITEVSRRSGVASSALRFYEDKGLIASERAASGHRRYPRSVLRRIAFIVFAQRIGLKLDEVGAALEKLPSGRSRSRGDRARLA